MKASGKNHVKVFSFLSFGKNKDYDLPNGARDFLFKRKRNGRERDMEREREEREGKNFSSTSNENKYYH